jgi:hypothetical protein
MQACFCFFTHAVCVYIEKRPKTLRKDEKHEEKTKNMCLSIEPCIATGMAPCETNNVVEINLGINLDTNVDINLDTKVVMNLDINLYRVNVCLWRY